MRARLQTKRHARRCKNMDALFDRVRRIELFIAFLAGINGLEMGGRIIATLAQ